MTEQTVTQLARQIGINPADAINAIKAEKAATDSGVPIYKWQQSNQEQATIIMRLHRQNELNAQKRD